jgi:hypothetical protein
LRVGKARQEGSVEQVRLASEHPESLSNSVG